MNPYDADNWALVDSSIVKAIGTKDHYLIVMFNKGGAYRYPHSAGMFGDLQASPSVGALFHEDVRGRDFDKLPPESMGWPED